MDPRCRLLIVMGKTDFNAAMHKQQSMILVDIQTPGVHIKRPLTVFGYDDAPHGHAEVIFDNVRVPAKNILTGEGRGFEIAQVLCALLCRNFVGTNLNPLREKLLAPSKGFLISKVSSFLAAQGNMGGDVVVASPNVASKSSQAGHDLDDNDKNDEDLC